MKLKLSLIVAFSGDDSSTLSRGKATVMSTTAGRTLQMYTLQCWLQSSTLLTLAPPVKYVKPTSTTSPSDHLWTVTPGRRSLEGG
jgi:hypothetical protein